MATAASASTRADATSVVGSVVGPAPADSSVFSMPSLSSDSVRSIYSSLVGYIERSTQAITSLVGDEESKQQPTRPRPVPVRKALRPNRAKQLHADGFTGFTRISESPPQISKAASAAVSPEHTLAAASSAASAVTVGSETRRQRLAGYRPISTPPPTENGCNSNVLPPAYLEGTSDLLSEAQLNSLVQSCPSRYSLSVWGRVYSMSVHGVSRSRFLEIVAEYPACLVVMKEIAGGSVFGGFASVPFSPDPRRGYYGSGECFVFKVQKQSSGAQQESATHGPAEKASSSTLEVPGSAAAASSLPGASPRSTAAVACASASGVSIYRWCGADEFWMFTGDQCLAMGGGGSYAWSIDTDFRYGHTGRCSTFDSPPLTDPPHFELNEMEVWAPVKDYDVVEDYLTHHQTTAPTQA